MKITWFGGTSLRVYVGARIVAIDPDAAPRAVDRNELLSGADRILSLAESGSPTVDPALWRPAVARPLEAEPELDVSSIGPSTLLISGIGDPPLLLADVSELPPLGRWAEGAVFVLFGERGAQLAESITVLDRSRPRLVALAAQEQVVDALFAKLAAASERPDVLGVTSLEPGLALEV